MGQKIDSVTYKLLTHISIWIFVMVPDREYGFDTHILLVIIWYDL